MPSAGKVLNSADRPPWSWGADMSDFCDSRTMCDPAKGQEKKIREKKAELKRAIKPESEVVRERWIEERIQSINPEDQEKHRECLKRAAIECRLLEDFVLYPLKGDAITVKDILDAPEKWKGMRLKDPLEPDYGGDARIAYIDSNGNGKPSIYSHAHGGQRYKLGAPIEKKDKGGNEQSEKEDEHHDDDLLWLNDKHAFVMIGGRACVLFEHYDPEMDRDDIKFWGIGDFHHRYSNRMVKRNDENGTPKSVPATKLWMKSMKRREYDGIIFAPRRDVNGYYNLFRGFAVEPRKGRWPLFREHIEKVVSGGDPAVSDYIFAWLAHLCQNPGGERPGTSIVLRGRQGTGKGIFAKQIGAIFGHHYLHITQASHLTGKFNSHLKDALLVFVDEALWAGDKQGESVLKALCTEDRIMIEHKGKDAIAMRNHVSLIIASNSEWVVPSGLEERRFLTIDVADSHMQDRAYFKAIMDEMDNGGREAMLYDLLSVQDLEEFDLRNIPATKATQEQKSYSMTGIQKFWFEILKRGSVLQDDEGWTNLVPTHLFHGQYLEFCKVHNERYPLATSTFSMQIRKFCRPFAVVREKHGWYNKETRENRTVPHLRLPSLQDCRNQFDKLMKQAIDWEDNS